MNRIKLVNFINWPNAVTALALLISWLAIIQLLQGRYYISFVLILTAFLVDFFDGWLARKLNQTSDFGRQFDSQADVFIYLVYPCLAFYLAFGLNQFYSIIIIFLVLLSGIFRLIRFNVVGYIADSANNSGYPGLPVVFSHLLLIIFYLLKVYQAPYFTLIANFSMLLFGWLMIQTFAFTKPKKFSWLIILLLAIIVLTLWQSAYGIDSF